MCLANVDSGAYLRNLGKVYYCVAEEARPLREIMNKPDHFEILEDHAVFRPTGEVSLEQAVQMVTSALVYTREQADKQAHGGGYRSNRL